MEKFYWQGLTTSFVDHTIQCAHFHFCVFKKILKCSSLRTFKKKNPKFIDAFQWIFFLIHKLILWSYCLHFDRSMRIQCSDWTHPYRSTFHSHDDCHVEDCRTPLCSGHSFLLLHFPAGMADKKKRDEVERREGDGGLLIKWLERFRQSTCQGGCLCFNVGTLHTHGVTQGSLLVLPSMLQLQGWQNGKPI